MKHIFLLLFVCFSFLNCSKSGDGSAIPSAVDLPADNTPTETPYPDDPLNPPAIASSIPPLNGSVQLIITPNPKGHVEFLQSISKTIAGDIIRMAMFHLTDNDVIDALGAAHKRGVTVKVILDGASLYLPNFKFGYDRLKSYGIDVRTGSTAFSISHQKSMVINQTEAFITAINLTKLTETTRDFGLIVHDANVINEVINSSAF
jgi:phosphatidylserine/phosphatidylglycerophosphate/cardiolipin synthase-like enzyme